MSLLKHGITPREEDCVEVNTLNDAYEEPLKALLTAPDHPTAMLVSDDILAVVLEQFCGKLGLHIPKDLSIVSFNNSLFSRITSPQLTTVDVNPYQLGMKPPVRPSTTSKTRTFWPQKSSCRTSSSRGRAAARRRRSEFKTKNHPRSFLMNGLNLVRSYRG